MGVYAKMHRQAVIKWKLFYNCDESFLLSLMQSAFAPHALKLHDFTFNLSIYLRIMWRNYDELN